MQMSVNGKILAGVKERHALVVLNGSEAKRTGTITRERSTSQNIEKSVLDFLILSTNLVQHVERMHIHEERHNVLTKIIKKRNKVVEKSESDHDTIIVEMNIKWKETTKQIYVEVFKYNDEEALKTFKQVTTDTNHLSKIFDTDKRVNVQTKKFLKRLQGFINKSFKKVKISNKSDVELDKLYDKRRYLRSNNSKEVKKELEKVEIELAEKYSDKMYNKIKEELAHIDSEDGGFNSGRLWKLKKKLSPKPHDPPTAMKNSV